MKATSAGEELFLTHLEQAITRNKISRLILLTEDGQGEITLRYVYEE